MARSARHRQRASTDALLPATAVLTAAAVLVGFAVATPSAPVSSATAETSYARTAEIVVDDLDRDTRGTWGSAAVGGEYGYVSPAGFSTDGAKGRVELESPGASRAASLGDVAARDVAISGRLSVGALPRGGNGVYSGFQARISGTTYYQVQTRVNPAGDLFLAAIRVNGSTADQTVLSSVLVARAAVTADSSLRLDVEVTGIDPVVVRARVWDETTEAPAWQLTAVDSSAERIAKDGSVGVWSYLSTGSRAQSVYFDDLAAYELAPDPTATTPSDPAPSTDPQHSASTGPIEPSTSASASPTSTTSPSPSVSTEPSATAVPGTPPRPAPTDEPIPVGSPSQSPSASSGPVASVRPTPSAAPSSSPSPSTSPAPVATVSPSPSSSPSATATPSPSASASPRATASPSPTASPRPSASPSVVPMPSPTIAPPTSSPVQPVPSAPAPTPSAPVGPDPTVPSSGTSGAAAIGSTSYPVPSGALFVESNAAGGGDGSSARPFRSIQAAVTAARAGGTVVVRGGTYHESVTVQIGSRVTIQSAPGEAVWLDGSSPISGFSSSGSVWVAGGYTPQFDRSATYSRGKADSRTPGWAFVSPAAPMAAAPDQVFIDGVAQQQVSSLAEVGPGEFFVDLSTDRLFLGTDPTGRSVRISDLVKAVTMRGAGSQLLGIGVQRYAPSVPDFGAVTVERPDILVENVAILDSATGGISVSSTNDIVRRVTVSRSGLLGMHANSADGLVVDGLLATENNDERFNTSPVSGGLKVTRSRDVEVRNGTYTGNIGPGIWFDESVYDTVITGNTSNANTGSGVKLEISSDSVIADNTFLDNGENGIKINNTSNVEIWNNTVAGNDRNINITGDDRRASNTSTAGHDPRRPNPDPTMTWINGPIGISNNIIGASTGNCSICVEDYAHLMSAADMKVTVNGNLLQDATSRWSVIWSRGAGDPAVFTGYPAFAAATGQNPGLITRLLPIDAAGLLSPVLRLDALAVARPIPAAVASEIGVATGTRHIGAW